MGTTRLQIYNGALAHCGERSITDLNVNEEGRRLLDDVWNNGGVDYCLEQGQWKFAMRTQKLDYETDVTPQFGYRRAFTRGTDWLMTSAVCSDEYFNQPLMRYSDETAYLYADLDVIYVKFVSNDPAYGGNLSLWPNSFTQFVMAYFAWKICLKLTGDEGRDHRLQDPAVEHRGILPQAKRTAMNKDAMKDPSKYPAPGNWVRSRRGNASQWRDGGSRNQLIG